MLRKAAVIEQGLARRPAVRTRGRVEAWLYPGEARLPADSPFERLEVRLPQAEYNLLGWRTSWLWGTLAASLLTGLLLKKPLRVEF